MSNLAKKYEELYGIVIARRDELTKELAKAEKDKKEFNASKCRSSYLAYISDPSDSDSISSRIRHAKIEMNRFNAEFKTILDEIEAE